MSIHVSIKSLPESLQDALRALDYHKSDIGVEIRESVVLLDSSGDGRRAFVALVDLSTGHYEVKHGSWGGANAFTQNAIDSDNRNHAIPPNTAVIKGSQSSHGIYAVIYISPACVVPNLLPQTAAVSEKESKILYCFKALKSGPYRKDALARLNVSKSEIDSLVSRGFLKQNGTGTQITTEGKNAAAKNDY